MNETENIKVKRNLTALIEFSRIINSSLDLDFILNNILLTCMGKFFATKGLIAINKGGSFIPKSSKGFSNGAMENFPVMNVNVNLDEDKSFQKFLEKNNLSAAEVIEASNNRVGIICLGKKLSKSGYTDDDIEFLKTILNISSSAIQNSLVLNELKKVNRVLDSRINRLNSLFELSKEFGMFSESTRVSKLLVYSVIGQFLVSKFAVVSFTNEGIDILECKFNEDELLTGLSENDLSKIENSIRKDKLKDEYKEFFDLGIEIIVPMRLQNKTKGLIFLGRRINNQNYTEDDIEFIFSVGSLAIISLENQRLFHEEIEKQKMEEDLEIARDIQRNLLPGSIPEINNFQVAGDNVSSKQVGGDYYDVIFLDENNYCIAIADVSGKGVPASLLMANIQAFLQVICKQGMSIDEATGIINDLITDNTSDGKFITFFWGVLNSKNSTFNYVNAGHNPPLLIRDGKINRLEKGGMILGVMKTLTPYLSEEINLKKNDVIAMFTDGVTEAMNKDGEEFSDERLEKLLLDISDKSADEILKIIKKEVRKFSAGTTQSDDITLVVLKAQK